jgi:ribosomal protein S18 acetylase RimI-like enzyme
VEILGGIKMEIKSFNDSYINGVLDLWNKSCNNEMSYKPFTEESFRNKFINNVHFSYEGTFVGMEDGKIIGFANGLYKKEFLPGENFENTPGYLTFVLVDQHYRNKGYGSLLLKAVEDFLIGSGKKTIQIIFFNPINLEWFIPGSDNKHDHPNAPGVDIDSYAFEFFKKHHYMVRTREAAMYLDLAKFELDEKSLKKLAQLREKGITIEYFNANKHHGFDSLFDDLRHELWRKEIKDNLSLDRPYSIVVAADKGKICGFAGPIEVQQSGRGKFSGIGVDSKHQGLGIGKMLFFMLCESFKAEGAGFMSLFTGIENNAKRMYDAAGFNVVKTWAVMKKEI